MKKQIQKLSSLLKRSADTRSDVQLIAAIRNGEPKSFDALVLRFKKHLRQYLYRLLRSTTLADDAMQETFIEVWNKIRSGQYHDGDFTGWLNTIAFNKAKHIQRTERHYLHPQQEATVEPQQENPAVPLMDEEEKKFLLRLLDKLPAQARRILHMVFLTGMSIDEVAQALHRKPDSVRHCMRRALRKLEALLSCKYGSSYPSLRIT